MFNAICIVQTWYLVLLFSVAGFAKFLYPATSFAFYERLGVPICHMQAFSVVVIAVEISTVVLLVIPNYRFIGAIISMGLCGIFMSMHLVMPGDCGCFGDIKIHQNLVWWSALIGCISSVFIAYNQRRNNEYR